MCGEACLRLLAVWWPGVKGALEKAIVGTEMGMRE